MQQKTRGAAGPRLYPRTRAVRLKSQESGGQDTSGPHLMLIENCIYGIEDLAASEPETGSERFSITAPAR